MKKDVTGTTRKHHLTILDPRHRVSLLRVMPTAINHLKISLPHLTDFESCFNSAVEIDLLMKDLFKALILRENMRILRMPYRGGAYIIVTNQSSNIDLQSTYVPYLDQYILYMAICYVCTIQRTMEWART